MTNNNLQENSIKISIPTCTMFIILLYSFEFGIFDSIGGSKVISQSCIMLVVAILATFTLLKHKVHIWRTESLWLILLLLSFRHNQDLLYDTPSRWIPFLCGVIYIFFLCYYTKWMDMYIINLKFYTLFHVFFTLLFFIIPPLFYIIAPNILTDFSQITIDQFESREMPGLTAHYSTNGIYLAIGLLFMGASFMRKRNFYTTVGFIVTFIALLLTKKRSSVVFPVIALLALYYTCHAREKRTRFIKVISILIAVVIVFLLTSLFVPAVAGFKDRLLGNGISAGYSNGRIYFWRFAIQKFIENPILGVGWGGFKHEYYRHRGVYNVLESYVDCHNTYIQILCELGIIGFIAFVLAVYKTLFGTYKMLEQKIKCKCMDDKNTVLLMISFGIQVYFSIYAFVGNPLYDVQIFYPYITGCGIYYVLCRRGINLC